MATYRFSGRVVDQTTHGGRANLRVEAWDAENRCTDLVAFAITDAQGAFTMALEDTYLATLFQDRPPAITFRVFTIPSGDAIAQRLPSRYFVWKLVNERTTGRLELTAGSSVPTNPTPSAARCVGRRHATTIGLLVETRSFVGS